MVLRRDHGLPRQEVKRRIDDVIDALLVSPPGGLVIRDVVRQWTGDTMTFSFKAEKRIIGIAKTVALSGQVIITDHDVTLTSEPPAVVKAFVSEDRIRAVFEREFDQRIVRA